MKRKPLLCRVLQGTGKAVFFAEILLNCIPYVTFTPEWLLLLPQTDTADETLPKHL